MFSQVPTRLANDAQNSATQQQQQITEITKQKEKRLNFRLVVLCNVQFNKARFVVVRQRASRALQELQMYIWLMGAPNVM